MNNGDSRPTIWGRRDWLTRVFWAGVLIPIGISLLGFVRFLFPRVLFEPSTSFIAGRPEDYTIGRVNSRWKKSKKVWIVRDQEGIFALFARCTHLGCTPGWFKDMNKFKCFCHGSGFRNSGINFEGPAPRPLERCMIELNDDGELVVDTAIRYRFEKSEWNKPGAFLRI